MAAVSVFVDDAVRGRLPMVCAKTGRPTDEVIRTTRPVGGGVSGMAWILVFFGPPGWLALLVVALLGSGREQLTVRIPRTHASFDWERQMRRYTWGAAGLGLASVLLSLRLAGQIPLLWLALAASFFVGAAVFHGLVYFNAIGISLDGSRRWVTLTNVHPDFVRAVEAAGSQLQRS